MSDQVYQIIHIRIGAILIMVSTLGLGFFVFFKNPRKGLSRFFGLYYLSVSAWCFSFYQMITNPIPEESLFWARFLHFPSSFIPATFLHFIQHLLNIEKKTLHRSLRFLFYSVGAVFIIISFRSEFVSSIYLTQGMSYLRWGPWYKFYFISFSFSVFTVFSILIFEFQKAASQKKTQIFYVILSYLLAYGGGCTVFLPHWGIQFPWWSFYLVFIAQLILLYAILKHNLLDIRIFVRRLGLFVGIYTLLMVGIVPIVLIAHKKWLGLNSSLSFFIITESFLIACILSTGPFLYAYFIRRNSFFHEHSMAGLTHELKSPLAAIESALEQLNSIELGNPKTSKEKDYVEMIERNSIRLRKLVEDLLLTFRDPKALTQETSIKINLNELCQQVADEFRPEIESKDLIFTFSPSEKALFVQGDPSKLKQVVSNLLSNALKFTSEGEIQLIIKGKNGAVTVEVKDTGLGIPADELPYVFDRFFRGRESKTRKGTGIGLTIAKAWVEAHGGKIWAESEGQGMGARIMVSFFR